MKRRDLIKGGLCGVIGLTVSAPAFAFSNDAEFSAQGRTGAAGPTVINAGVGGDNTVNLLERIDKDCLVHKPTLTVLMVGTNDMNSVKHIPLADYERNLEIIVDKIKKTGSKILILSILPAYEPYLLTRHPAAFYQPEGVQGRRIALNQVIEKVAAKNKFFYMDLCHRFEAIGNIGTGMDSLIQNESNAGKTDGIHPTANGYRFIGMSVYDFIVDHKLPTDTIVCFGDSITKGDGSIDKQSYPAYLKQLLS
jgi:lysophospholipase L1-like esterase